MFRLILSLFLFSALPVSAEETIPVLTVTGTGSVQAVPDLASVSLGVEEEAPTADRAIRANSARMRDIFAALEASGIARKDIQTSQLTLYPQRDNSAGSTLPKVIGFVASNMVQITVRNIDQLGVVLDTLTKAGANRIQGVSFGVANPGPLLDQARQAAVAEAIRKAGLYATAASLPLGAILSIDEGFGASPAPMYKMAAMADAVPVAEGELTFSEAVTSRFALSK